jgi:hypothetical protein
MLLNDSKRLKLLNNLVINFFLYYKINFWTHFKLIINDVEIIACKLELFKGTVQRDGSGRN